MRQKRLTLSLDVEGAELGLKGVDFNEFFIQIHVARGKKFKKNGEFLHHMDTFWKSNFLHKVIYLAS